MGLNDDILLLLYIRAHNFELKRRGQAQLIINDISISEENNLKSA